MGADHSAAEGARRDSHQKVKLFSVWLNGLLKPTDDVGQQLNDKIKVEVSQSSNIKKTSKIKGRYAICGKCPIVLGIMIESKLLFFIWKARSKCLLRNRYLT